MSTLMLMLLSGDVSVDPGPMAGPMGESYNVHNARPVIGSKGTTTPPPLPPLFFMASLPSYQKNLFSMYY